MTAVAAALWAAFAGAVPAHAAGQAVPGGPLPWAAAEQQPSRQTLSFRNGRAQLQGTLYLPPGRSKSPVVIAFHGASDPLRTAPLYRHLTELLPPLGIGIFLFDRRGSGASTGPAAGGSFELLAGDGVAARRMLERARGVDASAIGYWGLSQGGWLAALAAAADPRAAFAISVSAPVVPADMQMRFAAANILRIRGFSETDVAAGVAARQVVDDFMKGRRTRAETQRIVDAAAGQPWFPYIYMSRTFADPASSPWAREIANDPFASVLKVKSPMLLLFGSRDPWIPVAASVEKLRRHPAGKRLVHVMAGADHAMMTSVPPLAQVDPERMTKQAPEAPA